MPGAVVGLRGEGSAVDWRRESPSSPGTHISWERQAVNKATENMSWRKQGREGARRVGSKRWQFSFWKGRQGVKARRRWQSKLCVFLGREPSLHRQCWVCNLQAGPGRTCRVWGAFRGPVSQWLSEQGGVMKRVKTARGLWELPTELSLSYTRSHGLGGSCSDCVWLYVSGCHVDRGEAGWSVVINSERGDGGSGCQW